MAFANLPATVVGGTLDELRDALNQILLYISAGPKLSALVLFDGTPATPVFVFGQNVSSTITKLGVGNYRITFSAPYVGVRYIANASAHTGAVQLFARAYNRTATTVDVLVTTLAGVATDSATCQVSVIDIPA